ncbi:hypothetical protein D3C76_587210 [compost metagenome]|uniref:Uncharacterized conserved protein YjiS, DUF1127 family n=1 Tax=Pseudomonas jinjuensis TaxID=198616 RepID=A0A1H0FBM3_9PSED|nr:DUF1127 domain-containing protein [Pseudomonas jinjuensis]SDN92070.1 Uncharacterized conserved protein YjiS, DUF1127 family [Pseudomonas jinjuensis]
MKGQLGFVATSYKTPRREIAAPIWKRALAVLRRWLQLHRQRQNLASLSDATLKDIGLTRADVDREIHRHFWDDPLKH